MKYIVIFILAIAIMIACACCSSKSGELAEKRRIEAKKADLEAKEAIGRKRLEIYQGYDAIIIENSTAFYKVISDTVAVRTADNVFFHKRRAKDINMGYWRYYRVY